MLALDPPDARAYLEEARGWLFPPPSEHASRFVRKSWAIRQGVPFGEESVTHACTVGGMVIGQRLLSRRLLPLSIYDVSFAQAQTLCRQDPEFRRALDALYQVAHGPRAHRCGSWDDDDEFLLGDPRVGHTHRVITWLTHWTDDHASVDDVFQAYERAVKLVVEQDELRV